MPGNRLKDNTGIGTLYAGWVVIIEHQLSFENCSLEMLLDWLVLVLL